MSKEDLDSLLHHPKHYTRLDPEPWDVAITWGLGALEGAILKYLARAGHKDGEDRLSALRKALTYAVRLNQQDQLQIPQRLTTPYIAKQWGFPIEGLALLEHLSPVYQREDYQRRLLQYIEKLIREENE
jgi:hypothetical protein